MSDKSAARFLTNLLQRVVACPGPESAGVLDTLFLAVVENTPCSCFGPGDHCLTGLEERRAEYLGPTSSPVAAQSQWETVFRAVLILFLDAHGDQLAICRGCGKLFLRYLRNAKGKRLQGCCSGECRRRWDRMRQDSRQRGTAVNCSWRERYLEYLSLYTVASRSRTAREPGREYPLHGYSLRSKRAKGFKGTHAAGLPCMLPTSAIKS